MKKTFSMIIAIAMIAAMLATMGIFASATGVVEVSTWAEFVEQANANFGEGSYKLTADSTADASVEGFYGTFDGGDHTITASTTLFEDVCGPAVIKNFTVNPAKDAGGNEIVFTVNPVIHRLVGSFKDMPVWISGVTNNVSVGLLPEYELDGSSLQDPTGGIIGLTDSENWIYMYNVVNNGNIVSDDQTGGIIGNCAHTSGATYLTMVNVVNNGDVFAYNSYAGGIVGNVNAQLYGDFRYCINNGNVSSENDAGGIIGQVNGKAYVEFSYCANSGTIDQNPIITLSDGTERKLTGRDKTGAKYGAAGICPRFSNADVVVTMDNCVVMGALDNDSNEDNTAYSSADPFNGYANGNTITLTNCSYLYGMNVIGEQASTLKPDATGFIALDQIACQAAFDAIVAAAPNQPAPEIETPELTPVDLVNVNGYVSPTAGADIAKSLAGITVPEGAPYSISDAYWYNETLDRNESYGTFIAGCTYRLNIKIYTNSGYVFADDLVMQFNGDASLVDTDRSYSGTDYAYLYSVTTRLEGELITVDAVNVNGYVAPTVGADIAESLAGITVPEGAPYSIDYVGWYNETIDSFCTEGTFIAGYTYRLGVVIRVASGYIFSDELVMQFNGDASLVDRNFGYCYYEADYAYLFSVATELSAEGGDDPTESTVIDTVNVNGYVAPTVGDDIAESLAGITAPEGAPYSINTYWYNETLDRNESYGTFIAGCTYRLNVDIYVDSGYIFADDLVMQFNGDASLVDLDFGYCGFGADFAYLYSVATQLEGELITVDTVNVNGYVAPTVGADIAESLAGITVPEGAPYSINTYWYNETLDRNESYGTFIAGCTYRLNVDIYVDSGYILADDLVMQFNGDASLVDRDFGYCGFGAVFAYLYSVATELSAEGGDDPTESTVIDTINVNGYAEPTVGASLADTLAGVSVPAGAPYSIVDAYWYNDTLGIMATEETFLAGNSYSLRVEIRLADGYVFADEYTIQLNGDASLVDVESTYEVNASDLVLWSVITELPAEGGDEPTEKIEIDSVDVSGITAPTHGQTVADYKASLTLVLPDGANYSVFSITITEFNPETMEIIDMLEDGDVFDSSKTYSVGILVEADDGYVFATDAVLTANGGEDEPIDALIDGDKAGVAVAFTPAEGGDTPTEPTEKIEIDKIDVSGITAPENGQTVADYAASFVPELPEDAKYDITSIYWFELDPETMRPTTDDPLADDYVFDSTKTYGFQLNVEADDGYEFATDAVITVNGGTTELYGSNAGGDIAALAIVFNPAPATGDNSAIAIFAIAAVATIGCVALALRKKED